MTSWRGRGAAAAVLLVLLVAAVYLPAVRFPFVNFDDDLYVSGNPKVRGGLTAEGVRWAFGSFHAGYWIPLTWLSYMVDADVWGDDAGGYHFTNLLLHAAGAVVLLAALGSLTGAFWRSALVAGLFAAHPLHVESVAWVTERKDVLSGFLAMGTLLLHLRYLRKPGGWRMAGTVGSFLCAVAAKPMAVTLPVLFLVLDWWPLARLRLGWGRLAAEKLPLLVPAAAVGAVTLAAQSEMATVPMTRLSLSSRLANAVVSLATYPWKMICPRGLRVIYLLPDAGYPWWLVALSAAFLGAAGALALWGVRRKPSLCAGFCWYLAALLPVSGLFQAGFQSVADRFAYLPLLGVYVGVVWALPAPGEGRLGTALAAVLGSALVLALAVTARHQVETWKDSRSLFERVLLFDPSNWVAHNNLGAEYLRLGKPLEAAEHLKEVIRQKPRLPKARYHLGNALRAAGRVEEAIAQYREAVRIAPGIPEPYGDLGAALAGSGRLTEAAEVFTAAVRLVPGNSGARFNLGLTLEKMGRTAEAAERYREALRLDSSFAPARARLERLKEMPAK